MSRLLSFLFALAGLFMAGLAAAQTPPAPPAEPPAQTAPAGTAAQTAPAEPAARTAPVAQTPPVAAAAPAAPAPSIVPPPLTPENTWNLDLSTGGRVVIQLRPDAAPQTVERIRTLTRQGLYNGLAFFRVIDGFMAQGGDPQNNGTGGSTLPDLPAEIHGMLHVRGAVGMARAQDLNSANSQFYIMFVPRLQMDPQYTVFGRVVSGMNYVDAIERGEPPMAPSRIIRASLGTDNLPPMTAEQIQAEATRLAAAAPVAPAAGGPNTARPVGPAVPAPSAAPHPLEPVRAPGAPPRRPRTPQ